MIEFGVTEGGNVKVDQWCGSPTVYLDTWAWRKISESEPDAKRFSTALKSRNGTLALSWLNLTEFSRLLTDVQQARKADALLDEILPQVFILNPNFFKVISEEDKLLAGGVPAAPHADLVFLKFFTKHNLCKPTSLKLLPEQSLFQLTQASAIATPFGRFADLIISHIESLRRNYANNRKFCLAVKRIPKGQPIQRGTRFIARKLLGGVLMDARVNFDRNDVIDVCHAVVPVAYCDYV